MMRQREHIEAVVAVTKRSEALAPARSPESIIQTSWRRCVHQYGLDPSRMQEVRILPSTAC